MREIPYLYVPVIHKPIRSQLIQLRAFSQLVYEERLRIVEKSGEKNFKNANRVGEALEWTVEARLQRRR